jgi:tRNA(Ile)-lysidine synthase
MTASLDHILNAPDLSRTAAYREVVRGLNSPALIACSGGVDSSALVVLAAAASRKTRIAPCVVVHVDHMSRPDSETEALSVRELCRACQLPFIPVKVAQSGTPSGRSTEDVWRQQRYEVLAGTAARIGIEHIVTAHTRDDQVENIVMRLMSGSSVLTMRDTTDMDIRGRTYHVVRPLLDVSRAELISVLSIAGVEPVLDPSNADTAYRRNAVRHELLPVIEAVFPGYDRALIRSAVMREQDAGYCDEVAARSYHTWVKRDADGSLLVPRSLAECLHEAVSLRILRLAARDLIQETDDRELTFERIRALLVACCGRSGSVIQLPYGVRARVESQDLRLFRAEEGSFDGGALAGS